MIDREARNQMAELLRHFISGQITNENFEENTPNSKDPIITAIWNSIWLFYDDFKEHKLKGEWALPKETKNIMARWVMFLHTNEEYSWPSFSYAGVRPLKHGWFSRLLRKPLKEQKFMESGVYSVWPFINTESYNNAKSNPKLLSNS